MDRFRRFAALAVALGFAGPTVARGTIAGADRYIVLGNGEKIGTLVAERTGRRVRIDFRIDDNGRGPKLREELTLDASGRPTTRASGRSACTRAPRWRLRAASSLRCPRARCAPRGCAR